MNDGWAWFLFKKIKIKAFCMCQHIFGIKGESKAKQ